MKSVNVFIFLTIALGVCSAKSSLQCICNQESGGCKPIGCKPGQSGSIKCGFFQITEDYYLHCKMPDRKKGESVDAAWKRCANNYECAKLCVTNYWRKYKGRCNVENPHEQIARLHNGGPNGCKNAAATQAYWEKIRTCQSTPPKPPAPIVSPHGSSGGNVPAQVPKVNTPEKPVQINPGNFIPGWIKPGPPPVAGVKPPVDGVPGATNNGNGGTGAPPGNTHGGQPAGTGGPQQIHVNGAPGANNPGMQPLPKTEKPRESDNNEETQPGESGKIDEGGDSEKSSENENNDDFNEGHSGGKDNRGENDDTFPENNDTGSDGNFGDNFPEDSDQMNGGEMDEPFPDDDGKDFNGDSENPFPEDNGPNIDGEFGGPGQEQPFPGDDGVSMDGNFEGQFQEQPYPNDNGPNNDGNFGGSFQEQNSPAYNGPNGDGNFEAPFQGYNDQGFEGDFGGQFQGDGGGGFYGDY